MPSRPGIARSSDSTSGLQRAACRQRLVSVFHGRDDVEAAAVERVGEQPAHEGGVVGDDDSQRSR